jgi:threonine/homoserine/homoserine lactone efflux protein
MDDRLLAFAVVATLLTVTPGPDMALITRNTLASGTRAGLSTSAGVLLGLVVWAALSAGGIAAVLATSAVAFTVLKLAGAAYLIVLGAATLWGTRRSLGGAASEGRLPKLATRHFRQGLLSNLLNPKVGVFYTTLLPQFISRGDSVIWATAALTGLHLAISVGWLCLFTVIIARLKAVLSREAVKRAFEAATGVALVGLGFRVATERGTLR